MKAYKIKEWVVYTDSKCNVINSYRHLNSPTSWLVHGTTAWGVWAPRPFLSPAASRSSYARREMTSLRQYFGRCPMPLGALDRCSAPRPPQKTPSWPPLPPSANLTHLSVRPSYRVSLVLWVGFLFCVLSTVSIVSKFVSGAVISKLYLSLVCPKVVIYFHSFFALFGSITSFYSTDICLCLVIFSLLRFTLLFLFSFISTVSFFVSLTVFCYYAGCLLSFVWWFLFC